MTDEQYVRVFLKYADIQPRIGVINRVDWDVRIELERINLIKRLQNIFDKYYPPTRGEMILRWAIATGNDSTLAFAYCLLTSPENQEIFSQPYEKPDGILQDLMMIYDV